MSANNVYKNVHNIFIHDNKILLATEVIINRRMEEQFVVYLYNKILLTIKNLSIDTLNNMDKLQKCYAE